MPKPPLPLTALSEAQRTQALERFAIIRPAFDLLYLRETTHSNDMWQADHPPLDIWLLDERGKAARPYLTVEESLKDNFLMRGPKFRIFPNDTGHVLEEDKWYSRITNIFQCSMVAVRSF